MNVRSRKPWNTKNGVTQYFRFTVDTFFVLDFFISLMCTVYDWENYCFGYLYTQTSQIDCFRHVHNFWINLKQVTKISQFYSLYIQVFLKSHGV